VCVCVDINRGEMGDGCVWKEIGDGNCGMVFLQGDCCGVCVDINRGEMGDGCYMGEIGGGS
jgi:hypothetical protein